MTQETGLAISVTDMVSMASNAIVAVAAIAAAVIAWCGLSAWRDQLSGTVEYELARRIFRGVFRRRDAVSNLRSPFILASEIPEPPPGQPETMDQAKARYYGVSKAYQARLDLLSEARREIAPDLLEAEVLWGRELKLLIRAIRNLENELIFAVGHHVELRDPDNTIEHKEAIKRIMKDRRDVLYEGGDGETDPFADDYAAAVLAVEEYLKPHLRRPGGRRKKAFVRRKIAGAEEKK